MTAAAAAASSARRTTLTGALAAVLATVALVVVGALQGKARTGGREDGMVSEFVRIYSRDGCGREDVSRRGVARQRAVHVVNYGINQRSGRRWTLETAMGGCRRPCANAVTQSDLEIPIGRDRPAGSAGPATALFFTWPDDIKSRLLVLSRLLPGIRTRNEWSAC